MHPQYGLQMKPLKTWWELNVDDGVWITIGLEAILARISPSFLLQIFSTEIKHFEKTRGKFLVEIN